MSQLATLAPSLPLPRNSPTESELVCDGVFYHPNEIWDLKSCPFDHRVFSTVYTSGNERKSCLSVWKILKLNGLSNSPQLEQLFELSGHMGKIRRWTPVSVGFWLL
jgi:EARP and GARP complex-interacting protein 1